MKVHRNTLLRPGPVVKRGPVFVWEAETHFSAHFRPLKTKDIEFTTFVLYGPKTEENAKITFFVHFLEKL